MQVRRGTLQHAGSSAWLQAMLGPGNSDCHAELEAALQVVHRTCVRLEHPLLRALLIMDGAFGWVPFITACRRAGIPALTRLTRLLLFEQPDVLRRLRDGRWLMVPDSCSGPRRSALDLGLVTLPAAEDTKQPDGTPYEPITVRVVVSRYPRKEPAEHGKVLDGWQYEMFIVDVPAEALPAPDAVALYFARAGQENRFAQEDRELGLDRILSFHLPGQEFAVIVGLWVWNLLLVRGFELEPPPAVRPAQQPYVELVDTRAPLGTAPDARNGAEHACSSGGGQTEAVPETVAAPRSPETSETPCLPDVTGASPTAETDTSALAVEHITTVDQAAAAPMVAGLATTPETDNLLEELRQLDWSQLLRHHPNCSWDAATGDLRCADGRNLVLTTVRKKGGKSGRTGIIFCRPVPGCDPCDSRPGCFESARPHASKHIELAVPTPVATRLRDLLRTRRTPG